MIEKIQKVYDEIKHKYSNGENNAKVRLLLKTELLFELDDTVEVKCDEENNSPDILSFNCLVAKIVWNKEPNGSYKYTNLVFGDEHNIGQVQFLVNNLKKEQQCAIHIVRHSCDMITEEYIYKNDFRFQRTMTHGIWFVTYQNNLITFGQYRHDLEQWIDSNYV